MSTALLGLYTREWPECLVGNNVDTRRCPGTSVSCLGFSCLITTKKALIKGKLFGWEFDISSLCLIFLGKKTICAPRNGSSLESMDSTLVVDSNPQSTANTATSSSSLQGRRAACDRCRGQKLRCIREDRNGECVRCTTAGTTCRFSLSMRTGRPPNISNTASPTQRRGKQKPGQGGPKSKVSNPGGKANDHHGSESVTRSPSVSLGDGDGDIDTARRYSSTEELVSGPPKSLPMHDALAFSSYPGSAGGMPSFYAGEDLVNLENFGSDFDWSFPQVPILSKDVSIPASSLVGRDQRVLHAGLGQNEKVGNDFQMSESPGCIGSTTTLFDPAPRNLDSQVGIAGDAKAMEEHSIDFSMGDWDESDCGGKLPSEDTNSIPSSNEAQHRRMQEISELTMSLYSLITTVDQQQPSHPATKTASSSLANNLQDPFVGSVLKYSKAFLMILRSFHPSTSPSLLTRPMTQYSALGSSDSDGSASDSASVFGNVTRTCSAHKKRSCQESSLRGHHSLASRSAFSSSNANDSHSRPSSADMTTVFQLLTCYIHIIHLHSILYARILDHLLTSLPSLSNNRNRYKSTAPQQQQQQQQQEQQQQQKPPEQQPPPLFPGMQVDGVSLDDFSIFQIKLILQINTHVLGEIEMALGLPDGFRISARIPGTTGVLETSVSVQFIEATMREIETTMLASDGGGDGNGRTPGGGFGVEMDRVSLIRENLVKLRKLLKGTINI